MQEKDPFGKPKTESIKLLRQACRTNLKFLCKEILGMTKWDDALHDDLQKFLEASGTHKIVLVPRGHLKSSVVTVGWAIQQMLIDPNTRILIRNAVWDQARIFLKQINGYLIGGPLVEIFGEFCHSNSLWTKDEIEIAQKKSQEKRGPSITTAGLETALAGKHFDTIIDDDLVNQQNVTTKEQIQKVISTYEDVHSLLDRGGKHVVVGTRWSNKDLYGHLLTTDTKSVNGVVVDPADGAEGWRNAYNRWVASRA